MIGTVATVEIIVSLEASNRAVPRCSGIKMCYSYIITSFSFSQSRSGATLCNRDGCLVGISFKVAWKNAIDIEGLAYRFLAKGMA